jgi:hypothetical protein
VSEITRVVKTFIGYLKRPDLYPELGRKILKNTINRNNAFKERKKQILGHLQNRFLRRKQFINFSEQIPEHSAMNSRIF